MKSERLNRYQREYVERGKRFIHENLDKKLTLELVARNAGVSKHHFSRLFKLSTGYNVVEYVNRRRICLAKKFLIEEMSVTEVCFTVGFNELSYFDRVFRRLVGMNPSEFQRQNRADK